MIRLVWRTGFAFLVLGALASAVAVLGYLGARPVEARDDDRARLLVVCEQGEVTDVVAALVATKADIWDLRTMKRLTRPAAAAPSPAEPTQVPEPGPTPPLRDARKVMDAILAAVDGAKPTNPTARPLVTEVVVVERRALVKLLVAADADVEGVAQALRADAWLKPRLTGVERGVLQRMPDGRYRASLSLLFDPTYPEPGKAKALRTIPVEAVAKAGLAARMSHMYASPVRVDPNRKLGFATVTREYTYAAATLAQLRTLLTRLGAAEPGLTVIELRWKLDPKSGMLAKPTIRLGGRSALE